MLGILGGTFDPIHEGHIAIAKHVLQAFKLDRIAFIPCFSPPHRDPPIASPEHRLAMTKLAIQGHPQFFVNDYEIQQQKISYTINTLKYLHQKHPDESLFLILGDDAFSQFQTWHQWEKITDYAELIVVTRTDKNNRPTLPTLSDKIHFDNITPIPVSATQIRASIRAGRKNIVGLHPAVEKYILENKVY